MDLPCRNPCALRHMPAGRRNRSLKRVLCRPNVVTTSGAVQIKMQTAPSRERPSGRDDLGSGQMGGGGWGEGVYWRASRRLSLARSLSCSIRPESDCIFPDSLETGFNWKGERISPRNFLLLLILFSFPLNLSLIWRPSGFHSGTEGCHSSSFSPSSRPLMHPRAVITQCPNIATGPA